MSLRDLIATATLIALPGCGATGGGMAGSPPAAPLVRETRPGSREPGPPPDDRRIAHLLNRLAYGPRPGDIERVRTIGLAAYVERQLNPEGLDDPRVDSTLRDLPTLRLPGPALLRDYPP